MAKQELPVDFKDDVLQAEMAGKRKYRIIQNEDETISLEDVTNYSQIGSNFGAAQMNATNLAVNESFDKNKVIDSLADIVANEATGYAAGALAVRELNGKITPLTDSVLRQPAQNYTAGQKYYFDADGWVYFECQTTKADGYCRFRIFNESDAEIFGFQANATATQQVAMQSGVYPVKKGWYTKLGQYQSAISQRFYFIKE